MASPVAAAAAAPMEETAVAGDVVMPTPLVEGDALEWCCRKN